MAEDGPTADELAEAKAFLKGTYALSLDSSSKIAAQLSQIQIDNLGIDYIQRRDKLIDAVSIADARRVAKRLYGGGILVTIAGKPKGLASRDSVGGTAHWRWCCRAAYPVSCQPRESGGIQYLRPSIILAKPSDDPECWI